MLDDQQDSQHLHQVERAAVSAAFVRTAGDLIEQVADPRDLQQQRRIRRGGGDDATNARLRFGGAGNAAGLPASRRSSQRRYAASEMPVVSAN